MNNTKKNNIISKKSYNPVYVNPEAKGNKNTSSISYNKKKIHINKNCIDTFIILWDCGLNPHS